MAEVNRIPDNSPEDSLEMEGFDLFFDENQDAQSTASGVQGSNPQIDQLINKLSELITLSVDQRMESSKLSQQLSDNQKQLIATQQILIKLMERSLELTRHVTSLEDKMAQVSDLSQVVESLKDRIIQLEGIETR